MFLVTLPEAKADWSRQTHQRFFHSRDCRRKVGMKKQYIYLLGIAGLGLAYPSIKEALGGGAIFAGTMLCVVILISWLAHRFGK
ncbi:MAG TPA: hypothetical protein VGD52_01080 [Pseudoduganella sp.]